MSKDYLVNSLAPAPDRINGYPCPPGGDGVAQRWLMGMERGWWSARMLPFAALCDINQEARFGPRAVQLCAIYKTQLEQCFREHTDRLRLRQELRRPRAFLPEHIHMFPMQALPMAIPPAFIRREDADAMAALQQECERMARELVFEKRLVAPEPIVQPVVPAVSAVEKYKSGLMRKGWRVVGKGAYSTVFVHDAKPGVAIKVNGGQSGDDCWSKFAVWAARFRKSPFIRVFAIHRHDGFTASLMERIEGDSYDGVTTLDREKQEQTKEIIDHYRYGSGLRVLIEDDLDSVAANAKLRWARRRAGTRVLAALRLLAKHNSINDLHRKNWGYRPDGSVVIFDPSTMFCGAIDKVKVPNRWSSYTYSKTEGLKEAA